VVSVGPYWRFKRGAPFVTVPSRRLKAQADCENSAESPHTTPPGKQRSAGGDQEQMAGIVEEAEEVSQHRIVEDLLY
jgi:hypothetical protein